MRVFQQIKIVLLFFIIPLFGWGQNYPVSYPKPLLEFTVLPEGFFDITHPQFRFGAEYFYHTNFSVGSDFGIGFTPFAYWLMDPDPQNYRNYHYYQFRPQLEAVINRNSSYNLQLGVEFFYMHLNTDYLNCCAEYTNIILFCPEIKYLKNKYGFNLTVSSKSYAKRFFMEIYFGLGWHYVFASLRNLENAYFFDKENFEKENYEITHSIGEIHKIFVGEKRYLGIAFGIKYGLFVKKKGKEKNILD